MNNYLLSKASDIFNNEGMASLIRRAVAYFISRVFRFGIYLLYEHSTETRDENKFQPKIKEFTFKLISTNNQADELVGEGFDDIRKAQVIVNVKKCLDKGGIAFCFFVGKELAHIGWLAFTENAKRCFDKLPYSVNFNLKQACSGGTVTITKYEGNGFMKYGYYKRFEYCRERGYTTTRNAVAINNIAAQKAHGKFAPTIYAKAYYVQILCWQFWKERSLV